MRRKRTKRILLTLFAAALAVLLFFSLRYWQLHRALPGSGVAVPENVEVSLLPLNPFSRPGTPLRKIRGVVVHYVGNPGTSAENNRGYFAGLALSGETYASSHFIVGLDGEVIQCVPLTEIAYCSNDRNADTVSVEVCHPDENGEFAPETMEALKDLVAWLCAAFDLTEQDVIRHYDVSGKICPKYYVEHPEAWDAFRSELAEKLADSAGK